MNSSDPGFNISSVSSFAESNNVSMSLSPIFTSLSPPLSTSFSLSFSTPLSLSLSTPISLSPLPHDPALTIMVVLGLFVLFALVAACLAICRPSSTQEGRFEGGCSPGEALACGSSLSSEPQLKLWKRLGSYRRSYSCSYRKPPQRRPELDPANTHVTLVRPQADSIPQQPHLTMPCLFDFVTEI
ncbi:uncharacterized protein C10orf105-like [Osmerus eperlanus]|uniref:uncharacterized protein C10orf105-like n=1 Tax=Osmerus eperlanus TaxID=29151 RepID=UPI002E102BD4